MEENLICKKLKRFLKENGVYYQYRKNFYEQTKIRKNWYDTHSRRFNKCVGDSLQELCEGIIDKKSVLNFSFHWAETPQGHEFWEKIKDKWVNMFYINGF